VPVNHQCADLVSIFAASVAFTCVVTASNNANPASVLFVMADASAAVKVGKDSD
jgi:hypothetical protein